MDNLFCHLMRKNIKKKAAQLVPNEKNPNYRLTLLLKRTQIVSRRRFTSVASSGVKWRQTKHFFKNDNAISNRPWTAFDTMCFIFNKGYFDRLQN